MYSRFLWGPFIKKNKSRIVSPWIVNVIILSYIIHVKLHERCRRWKGTINTIVETISTHVTVLYKLWNQNKGCKLKNSNVLRVYSPSYQQIVLLIAIHITLENVYTCHLKKINTYLNLYIIATFRIHNDWQNIKNISISFR